MPVNTISVSATNPVHHQIDLGSGPTTLNMSGNGYAQVVQDMDSKLTVNMSGQSSLNLTTLSGALVGLQPATINVTGKDYLTLYDRGSSVNVSIAPGGTLVGSFSMTPYSFTSGKLVITGGAGSSFLNTWPSTVQNTEEAVIKTNVTGNGIFDVENKGVLQYPTYTTLARLEFGGAVSQDQLIHDSGIVQIDHPSQFKGHVTLETAAAPVVNHLAEIDLIGLAGADSYTFKNDMLSIYHGKSVIDVLRLTDHTAHGFAVEQTSSGVHIMAIDATHPAVASLPVHTLTG